VGVLPVVVLVAVAVPVLVIAFLTLRRKRVAGVQGAEGGQAELQREFADAERYEEQWRDEQRKPPHDESLY
jgi:hypothetical protein